jgi:hypothetical protein
MDDRDHRAPKGVKSFARLPRRRVVERSFAWLNRIRYPAKCYDALPANEEAWIDLAFIRLLVRRLAQQTNPKPQPIQSQALRRRPPAARRHR